MTTDRTQTVRPPAHPNRSAAPAEQPAASGFAQLLDAHAATRREGEAPVRRDERAPRDDRPAATRRATRPVTTAVTALASRGPARTCRPARRPVAT